MGPGRVARAARYPIKRAAINGPSSSSSSMARFMSNAELEGSRQNSFFLLPTLGQSRSSCAPRCFIPPENNLKIALHLLFQIVAAVVVASFFLTFSKELQRVVLPHRAILRAAAMVVVQLQQQCTRLVSRLLLAQNCNIYCSSSKQAKQ